MARELNAAGIPCTVILDSAVGYVMEQVDMVMVGAEGVVESGGVINKVKRGVCTTGGKLYNILFLLFYFTVLAFVVDKPSKILF